MSENMIEIYKITEIYLCNTYNFSHMYSNSTNRARSTRDLKKTLLRIDSCRSKASTHKDGNSQSGRSQVDFSLLREIDSRESY